MPKAPDLWPGMPRRSFDALKVYIGYLVDELGLRDWVIELSTKPAPEDAYAMVNVTYGRKLATVKVCREFRATVDGYEMPDAETQREVLVHELLHVHLDPIESLLRKAMPELIGQHAWAGVSTALHRDIELATDGLAHAIAGNFRLFEDPEG